MTLADNGQPFFDQDVAVTADGVRAMGKAADTGTDQLMSVHAVDKTTHEVIDGVVDLPVV